MSNETLQMGGFGITTLIIGVVILILNTVGVSLPDGLPVCGVIFTITGGVFAIAFVGMAVVEWTKKTIRR